MPETTNKRLEQLRRQVYGKQEFKIESSQFVVKNVSTNSTSDTVYLKKDLRKIAIFSSLILSIQIILYLVIKNNLLNIT